MRKGLTPSIAAQMATPESPSRLSDIQSSEGLETALNPSLRIS